MLSHRGLWSSGSGLHENSKAMTATRGLLPLPLSHAYGLIVTIGGMHAEEPRLSVLQRWFNAEDWVRLVEEHRLESSSVVPSMLTMLLALPLEDHDLTSLKYFGSGGAPLSPALRQEVLDRLGVEIFEGYGCTESQRRHLRVGSRRQPAGQRRQAAAARRGRHPGRRRPARRRRRGRRDLRARSRRHEGLLEGRAADRRDRRRRLPAHRRHRPPGRRRLPLHRRPQEGPHHPGWLQRLPPRRRGRPARPPRRHPGRRRGASGRGARRGGRRLRRPAGRARPRPARSWSRTAGSTCRSTSTPARCGSWRRCR